MKQVTMYTTPICGYCVMAKRLLSSKDIPYTEVDVAGDAEKRLWLVNETGQRTVPQIFIGDQSVGGYRELSALARSGELDDMLDS